MWNDNQLKLKILTKKSKQALKKFWSNVIADYSMDNKTFMTWGKQGAYNLSQM